MLNMGPNHPLMQKSNVGFPEKTDVDLFLNIQLQKEAKWSELVQDPMLISYCEPSWNS